MLSDLWLEFFNVGSRFRPSSECRRDDSFHESVHFLDLINAWILDCSQGGGIVDRHCVRLVFIRQHAVNQEIDSNLALLILGHLDVVLNAGGRGKIVRCNFADFLQELLSSSCRHFLEVNRGVQAILKSGSRSYLGHFSVVFVVVLHTVCERGCWAFWFDWFLWFFVWHYHVFRIFIVC